MIINLHSYYSLRYGTLSLEQWTELLQKNGYDTAVLTDINNSTGGLEYIKHCRETGFNGIPGMEFRNGDELLYIGIAKNEKGFQELNELMTYSNLNKTPLPAVPPPFQHVFVVFPFGTRELHQLQENEFIGIRPEHLKKIMFAPRAHEEKYVMWQPITFADEAGYKFHRQLRAIDHNLLLSQLQPAQAATPREMLIPRDQLLKTFENHPLIIKNTEKLLTQCSFDFDFKQNRNKKVFTRSRYDDKLLLEKLALEGMKFRYGPNNKEAQRRVQKELEIIDNLGFSAYFLITHDILQYASSRGFYHVGRGSGANSVVAYCLRITEVCPIELDLYFERFLNPQRKSPPDFDVDFSWDERDEMYDYIFKRYGTRHTALLGAMSTFKDNSVIRELGKVYGLPKGEIDRIITHPDSLLNRHEITDLLLSIRKQIRGFPNLRTIHASGVLIAEEPLTVYTALDMPPKGLPTVQFDMYTAEDIGFEKFDILSQRGLGHIKECAGIVKKNQGISIDVHDFPTFKNDPEVNRQLKTGDTIGCFYIESPSMRQVLKKLHCEDYLTLVAASSIIRPGVGSSGMMRAYIERYHDEKKIKYLHPVMEEQLKETYGVMIYQEDVLKIGHHFGGLTLAEADVLRRMMSGKSRSAKHLQEIEEKYFENCRRFGYPEGVAEEVWRQIRSFAGYSFSKAHSASFALESYLSLHLKTRFPLEFMVAVINNDGGFYHTRVYVHEARKAGGIIHLPCVNTSENKTIINGRDIYLGFAYIQGLERLFATKIPRERKANGDYKDLEDVIHRTGLTPEQTEILIKAGAFRFTGKSKKNLYWEASTLHNNQVNECTSLLFRPQRKEFSIPRFDTNPIEDIYDEIETLRFPVSGSIFDMLKTNFRGDVMKNDLLNHVNRQVRMVGDFICDKLVYTKRKEFMKFGTFLDAEGEFFDTVHFPQSLQTYPLNGSGAYLIQGIVKEEFGFPTLEVQKLAKLPVKGDPRGS